MQNYENLEKSRGVVVFAFNTEQVDYVSIADQTSQLTAHALGLPITLITDHASDPQFNYDQVIRIDPQGQTHRLDLDFNQVTWRNFGRYLAYTLSPYQETVLLDTDYVVFDRSLLKLFETKFDYRLLHHNRTPAGASYEKMGETSLPFVWATVVLFRKTDCASMFFNLVGRVQRNYQYYRALYNIRERNYRNDYAFAIANNIINGYNLNEQQSIPWPMFTIEEKIKHIAPDKHFLKIYHNNLAVVVPYCNIHVMDKEYLQCDNFKHLVETICAPT
jgi:hypothetical protein